MSYIIGFFDKFKLQVNDEVGKQLQEFWKDGTIRSFQLNNNSYAFSSVERIVDKGTAYIAYPTEYELLSSMEDIKLLPSANVLPKGDSWLLK